jgi:RimJ/RimL family protein N-acetyltransferase
MMALKVRRYRPEDFLEVDISEQEKMSRSGKPLEWWASVKSKMVSVTLVTDKDEIVCCCGIHDQKDGSGEAWAVVSPSAGKHPQILQAVRHLLGFVQSQMDYTSIFAVVDPEWKEAVRFAEHLGFKWVAVEGRDGLELARYELDRKVEI